MHARDAKTRDILSCLGDPSRFELVLLLLDRERCVSDLAREVGLSQSCTTRHLQALARQGMVHGTRDGKRVLFRLCLERPAVSELLDWATRSSPHGLAQVHVDARERRARYRVPEAAPTRRRAHHEAPERLEADLPLVASLEPSARPVEAAAVQAPEATVGSETPASRPARRFQELEDFLL